MEEYSSSVTSSSIMIPAKFHPAKSFSFPKQSFGSKNEKCSFRVEWHQKYSWLHYDVITDAAFCYPCMKAEREKKYKSSTKHDPAFISKGFTNWKDATVAFNKHLKSDCHKEGVEIDELPKKTGDVGEKLSTEHKKEKELNREMFRRILQNICYLARQGLALKGHDNGANSNFTQLLRLRAFDCPAVLTWMEKKTNKYTSGNIQNECPQVMALHILRQISPDIAKNKIFYNHGR